MWVCSRRVPRTRPNAPSWRRVGLGLLAATLLATGCGRTSGQAGSGSGAPAPKSGLRLAPDPAFAAARIEVVFDDQWIDASTCTFVWKRNGSPIWKALGPHLDPHLFSKGDRITVEAKVPGRPGEPERSLSGQVDVLNTPPRIESVAIVMAAGSEFPTLEATVECADGDGDRLAYQYRWFRNDALIRDALEASLPASVFSRGDRVRVEVTAEDRESASLPVQSEAFQVQNLPPRITSRPLSPGSKEPAFRYQVKAEDADQDPLRFELVAGPSGMKVGPAGLVEWLLPAPNDRRGDHPVKIRVSDEKGGEALQEFSLHFD
jgi:hypothetical protein